MKDSKKTPADAGGGSSLLARSISPSLTKYKKESPFQLSTLERAYADTMVKKEAEQAVEEGKHPEASSQSEQRILSSILVNFENRNARIQTILIEVSSLVKEHDYTELQKSVAVLKKQKEAGEENVRDWMDSFEEENALRRNAEKELLEERSAKEEAKNITQCWKGAFEEEEKTAKRWKGTFEKERCLREMAEKKLIQERSAWADLAVQLTKAKKQNEDLFNTVSERCGQMTVLSGVDFSSSPTTPSGRAPPRS